MEWYLTLPLLFSAMIFVMALGVPMAFGFFLINCVGAYFFLGGEAGLVQMTRNASLSVSSFALAPIPLFILMGELMFQTGMASRAIDAVDRLIAKVPGRLSLVAVFGGTIFSALSGSTIANTAMLGTTLMPEMRARGYDARISMGPILGTGGIAMLIPPSALAVLLGSLGGIPVGELLIAGIVPGLILAALYALYIITRCHLQPNLAPAYELEQRGWVERFTPFLIYVLPLMTIFVVVVGSILLGIATPTESAALGSLATVIAALAYRSLTLRNLWRALTETVTLTIVIMFIICGSITFSQILSFSGATSGLIGYVNSWAGDPVTVIVGMLLVLLLLGCFMDQVSMMMVTLPFFIPLAQTLGVDLVWFGVMMLVALEIGFTSPPFGLLLFVMKGVAPPGTSMRDVYMAALPFILMQLLVLSMLLWQPGLIELIVQAVRI